LNDEIVGKFHFGGGEPRKTRNKDVKAKKSLKEIYAEIIQKSKEAKYAK